MLIKKIEAIYESYINGNISDTKKAVKRMSKRDFLFFFVMLMDREDNDFGKVVSEALRLLS